MPIYEYNCQQCGTFEITQRISEAPLKKCPTCGATVSKLISLSAFHLKGSGWYATDYAGNGSSPHKADDGKPASSEAKDSGTSSTSSSPSTKESSAKEEPSAT